MEKVINFSHESDIDGLGAVIVAKLAFENVDYVLMPDANKLEETFRDYLIKSRLDGYDYVFVTDLALYQPAVSMVNSDEKLNKKVFVFDHHKASIDRGLDKYDFCTIFETDEAGRKTCGTELYYNFLKEKNMIEETKALSTFVEYTRLEDNWLWKNEGKRGENAHSLAVLLSSCGKEEYITRMFSKLKEEKDSFSLNEEETKIVEDKKKEYKEKIVSILNEAEIFVDGSNNRYMAVFAPYEYRNELAEYIIENGNNEDVKYIIIIALDKGEYGQKSYRSICKDFDVNCVAISHGGGGHISAAAVNITKEQNAQALSMDKKEALKYLSESIYTK
ncbi:MAG: hypothetical protein IJ809_01220 [Clostridia bacterium]|nr:hypothetical protein [Clostridia bacterium]